MHGLLATVIYQYVCLPENMTIHHADAQNEQAVNIRVCNACMQSY